MEKTGLIIIRGNSGSGKSTLARAIRENSSRRVAIVEQDYLRRFVLKEKDIEGGDNIDLIRNVANYCLQNDYLVVLEGILDKRRYLEMLGGLIKSNNTKVFYLDVSFEQTLERHKSKSNSDEFGEKEMREWFNANDVLGVENETVLLESNSLEDSLKEIMQICNLKNNVA